VTGAFWRCSPEVIARYTTGSSSGATFTWVVSTHNPYNTMLMQTSMTVP
jgi:hypothetical protein